MHDDLDAEAQFHEEVNHVLAVTVGDLVRGVTAEEYLHWARNYLLNLMPSLSRDIPEEARPLVGYWMGVGLWNIAPQPKHGFRTQPLEKPQRNAPCPCGSGSKFKHCCANMPPPPVFVNNDEPFWEHFAQALPKQRIIEHCQRLEIPVDGLGIMSIHFINDGRYQQVIKMLDPLFVQQPHKLTERHGPLLNILIECYNAHYRTDRKKAALLEQLREHPNRHIRCKAWQRTATWHQDKGKLDDAHAALTEAMRTNPDDPSHAALEIILLTTRGEHEQARQRASFWLRRLHKAATEIPGIIDFLKQAQHDPRAALHDLHGPNPDNKIEERLLTWLNSLAARPVPYFDLIYDEDSEGTTLATLAPPKAIEKIEQRWRETISNSLEHADMGHSGLWNDPADAPWLTFLEQNPLSADSPMILEEVYTLIESHPEHEERFELIHASAPLLDHAVAILDDNLPDGDYQFPWLVWENRPALQMLFRAAMYERALGDALHAETLMRRYMQLNPSDNHGMRAELINHYLRQGNNQAAVALSEDFPKDIHADIAYGRALALFRLGKQDEAGRALQAACQEMPLVADYLLKQRVARPPISEGSFFYRGKDQAWLYREAARPIWENTPDAMAWLKKQCR